MDKGLYQVAYRNGWDANAKVEFSLAFPLFACWKVAQKKQELRIVSQQAFSRVLKVLFLLRRGDYACDYAQIQNTVRQANHLQLLFSVGYTTQ